MKTILLNEAVKFLREGEIIALPTETVYGLAASIEHPSAIETLFSLKGRPKNHPFSVALSSPEEVHKVAIDIPPLFWELAEKHLPGPLTLILKKHPSINPLITGGLDTIGVRIPSHPTAQALLKALGAPIALPSANLTGHPPLKTPAAIQAQFNGQIAAILEGECLYNAPSTLYSLVEGVLIRPGPIENF